RPAGTTATARVSRSRSRTSPRCTLRTAPRRGHPQTGASLLGAGSPEAPVNVIDVDPVHAVGVVAVVHPLVPGHGEMHGCAVPQTLLVDAVAVLVRGRHDVVARLVRHRDQLGGLAAAAGGVQDVHAWHLM